MQSNHKSYPGFNITRLSDDTIRLLIQLQIKLREVETFKPPYQRDNNRKYLLDKYGSRIIKIKNFQVYTERLENKISKAFAAIENISKFSTLIKESYLIKKTTLEEIVQDFKAAGVFKKQIDEFAKPIDEYADQISKISAIIDTISNNKVLKDLKENHSTPFNIESYLEKLIEPLNKELSKLNKKSKKTSLEIEASNVFAKKILRYYNIIDLITEVKRNKLSCAKSIQQEEQIRESKSSSSKSIVSFKSFASQKEYNADGTLRACKKAAIWLNK